MIALNALAIARKPIFFEGVVKLNKLSGDLVSRGEIDQRSMLPMGFADFDRGVQEGLQHRQPFSPQLLNHTSRQAGALLKRIDHDSRNLQLRIVVFLDFAHRAQ